MFIVFGLFFESFFFQVFILYSDFMSGGILTIIRIIATDLAKFLSQILHFPADKHNEHLFQ